MKIRKATLVNDDQQFVSNMLNCLEEAIYRLNVNDKIAMIGARSLYGRVKLINADFMRRVTHDIDLDVCDEETWDYIVANIVDSLEVVCGDIGFNIWHHRPMKNGSSSITIDCNGKDKFTQIGIDMNICQVSYNLLDVNASWCKLPVYNIYTNLVDKLTTVGHKQYSRRVKDFYDLYVLSRICTYRLQDVLDVINTRRPGALDDATPFVDRNDYEFIKHAFYKNRMFVDKDFDVVFSGACHFYDKFMSLYNSYSESGNIELLSISL